MNKNIEEIYYILEDLDNTGAYIRMLFYQDSANTLVELRGILGEVRERLDYLSNTIDTALVTLDEEIRDRT